VLSRSNSFRSLSWFAIACWIVSSVLASTWLTGAVRAADEKKPAAEKSAHAEGDAHGKDGHDKHAGGHGHDPHDLSHANAGPDLMKLMPDNVDTLKNDVKSDLALFSFVVFLLLFALLAKFAWGPIASGLDKRERHIADMISEAKHNAEKSEQLMREYQQKIVAAQEETRELMAQARRDGETLKEKIVSEAQATAARERDRAVEDIRTAKNAALQEIAQKSVDSAVNLAGRILHKEVRPQDHAQLIRESLEKFPSSN
jgi:F-type H+-transporting ATPase subunit b